MVIERSPRPVHGRIAVIRTKRKVWARLFVTRRRCDVPTLFGRGHQFSPATIRPNYCGCVLVVGGGGGGTSILSNEEKV